MFIHNCSFSPCHWLQESTIVLLFDPRPVQPMEPLQLRNFSLFILFPSYSLTLFSLSLTLFPLSLSCSHSLSFSFQSLIFYLPSSFKFTVFIIYLQSSVTQYVFFFLCVTCILFIKFQLCIDFSLLLVCIFLQLFSLFLPILSVFPLFIVKPCFPNSLTFHPLFNHSTLSDGALLDFGQHALSL